MTLQKPSSIARSEFRSAKWDEITEGRDFQPSDVPTITLLCQWYEVVEKCIDDIDVGGGIQVAYSNELGDIKALPQLATMKQASAEIRALNKQLGINDEAEGTDTKKRKATPLYVIQNNRKSRAKNTA